jgi:hypothetical protein
MWRTAIPHPFHLNFTNFKESNDCLHWIALERELLLWNAFAEEEH